MMMMMMGTQTATLAKFPTKHHKLHYQMPETQRAKSQLLMKEMIETQNRTTP